MIALVCLNLSYSGQSDDQPRCAAPWCYPQCTPWHGSELLLWGVQPEPQPCYNSYRSPAGPPASSRELRHPSSGYNTAERAQGVFLIPGELNLLSNSLLVAFPVFFDFDIVSSHLLSCRVVPKVLYKGDPSPEQRGSKQPKVLQRLKMFLGPIRVCLV